MIIYLVRRLLGRIKRNFDLHRRIALTCRSPCSQQGLPLYHVTVIDCELLPHSFHPYLSPTKARLRRYRFCGTFPRVTPGRR